MGEEVKEKKVKKVRVYSAVSDESGENILTKKLSLISARTGLNMSTMRTWFFRHKDDEGVLIYRSGEWKVSIVYMDEWSYSGQKRGDVENLRKAAGSKPVQNKRKEEKLDGDRVLIRDVYNDLRHEE